MRGKEYEEGGRRRMMGVITRLIMNVISQGRWRQSHFRVIFLVELIIQVLILRGWSGDRFVTEFYFKPFRTVICVI